MYLYFLGLAPLNIRASSSEPSEIEFCNEHFLGLNLNIFPEFIIHGFDNISGCRMVQFTIGLTLTKLYKTSCAANVPAKLAMANRQSVGLTAVSSIQVDFSTDNGLTWMPLESIVFEVPAVRVVHLVLPEAARNPATVLRWWQVDSATAPDPRLFISTYFY